MMRKRCFFASGLESPAYIDSLWLISFPRERQLLMDFMAETIRRDIGLDKIETVAGGETADIPSPAGVAERLNLPMQYVRKKPKGFGRGAQIEGKLDDG